MSILRDLIIWTERVDGLNGVAEAIKKIDSAENAIDYTAAASQLMAELAVATASTLFIRTAMSGLRLGLAISGQIWKWEGLSKLAGAAGGLTAGAIIDWINEQELGGKLYDWTHVDPLINTSYRTAASTRPPRPPRPPGH